MGYAECDEMVKIVFGTGDKSFGYAIYPDDGAGSICIQKLPRPVQVGSSYRDAGIPDEEVMTLVELIFPNVEGLRSLQRCVDRLVMKMQDRNTPEEASSNPPEQRK